MKFVVIVAVILFILIQIGIADAQQSSGSPSISRSKPTASPESSSPVRFRRVNIATNPVGWILFLPSVSASVALTERVAMRADVSLLYFLNGQGNPIVDTTLAAGVYLQRAYQGPFIEPGLRSFWVRDTYTASDSDRVVTDTKWAVGPQLMIGYHWMSDSGMNAAIALGGSGWAVERGDLLDRVVPNGYLRIGYAF